MERHRRQPDVVAQYDRALAEYRFQVDLNWRRSEYLFVLNLGTMAAATGLFVAADTTAWLVGLLFVAAAAMAGLSILANHTQRSYYQATRDQKRAIERQLGIRETLLIATTPGMGSRRARLGRITTFFQVMLTIIMLVDLSGAIAAFASSSRSASTLVFLDAGRSAASEDVGIARDDRAILQRLRSDGRAAIRLRPGRYTARRSGAPRCTDRFVVRPIAMQNIVLRCRD